MCIHKHVVFPSHCFEPTVNWREKIFFAKSAAFSPIWLWSNCRRVLYGKFNFMLLYGNLIFDLNPYFCMPLKLLMLWHDPKIWTKKSIIKNSKNSAVQTTFAVVVKSTASFYAPNAFINFDLGGVLFFQTFFTTIFLEGKNQHMWLETKKSFSN